MMLLALAAAWVLGIFLAVQFDVSGLALRLFGLSAVLLLLSIAGTRKRPLSVLLLLLALLGVLRVGLFGDDAGSGLVAYHAQGPVHVQGLVVSDPELSGTATSVRLRSHRIEAGGVWTDVGGDVLVTLGQPTVLAPGREGPSARYGDVLLLEGSLQAPPTFGGFDYPAYLARQGITSVMSFPDASLIAEGRGIVIYRWLYSMRRGIARSIASVVPEPQASVGQALLLGLRRTLPEDLEEEFRKTGTSHVLAISGLHVGILLGLSLVASQRVFGRRRQHYLIAPLVLIWMYALLAAMPPSAVRAAIMGTVYLAALGLGRPRSALPALGAAAAVMVGVDPNVLWDVSFQLSFAAMAGIVVMAEPLWLRFRTLIGVTPEAGASGRAFYDVIAGMVAMTVAAIIATLPLTAFYFERVSLVGLPTTLLVLPALPAVLVTQAIAGLVGLLSGWLALPLGWLAWGTTAYITGIVDLAARVPGSSIETGRLAPPLVWGYYGLLLLFYAAKPVRSGIRRVFDSLPNVPTPESLVERTVPWWLLVLAISSAAMVWIAAVSQPDGKLHVTIADVGQGDAVFITTPGGQHVLVDGGPDPIEAARLLGAKLPYWDRDIELVVLTHPHADHLVGLTEALRRYDVQRILERPIEYESPAYAAWREAVAEEGAIVTQARPGQVFAFEDGAYLQVLSPPEPLLRGTDSDVNNASVVLRLVYGDVSFLLTGDILALAEQALVSQAVTLDSDVLKVAHHGSRSSSSDEFLRRVSPAVAVVSAGEGNRFGHPHPETVTALQRHAGEDRVFRTDESGDIEFMTDGKRLEVTTER